MKKFPIPPTIKAFSQVFIEHGFSLYIVGGAVRDYLLGIENHDFDFCTDALPTQVISIFKTVIPTGIKHGTVTVRFCGNSYEVTTFRTEADYSDMRHPSSVEFVRNLEEDLSRRDFTVNAFAASCPDGKIFDYHNGFEDLEKGIIRAIGDPYLRFGEDALRLLRAARFASKLSFTLEETTFSAMKDLAPNIVKVSEERICDELCKTLMTKKPSVGLNLLVQTNLMQFILPEVDACNHVEQGGAHKFDVLGHILNAVDVCAYHNWDLQVRFAALFHDIGKPLVKKNEGDHFVFHTHDAVSAKLTDSIMRRLKFSNQMRETVVCLVANHAFSYNSQWTDGAVKRFVNRVGKENLQWLYELKWADLISIFGTCSFETTDELTQRIKDMENQPMKVKDLCINGNDLAQIGIEKGPKMGKVLIGLLEMVIDQPNLNNREELLKRAKLFKA